MGRNAEIPALGRVLDVTGPGVPVDFMAAAGRCYSSSRFARH